jgi:hypothetical protein
MRPGKAEGVRPLLAALVAGGRGRAAVTFGAKGGHHHTKWQELHSATLSRVEGLDWGFANSVMEGAPARGRLFLRFA